MVDKVVGPLEKRLHISGDPSEKLHVRKTVLLVGLLLAFATSGEVIIPAGAEYISDPVNCAIAPLSDLAITVHFAMPPVQQIGHPGSRSASRRRLRQNRFAKSL
jgi:hypothetical protein